VVCMKLLITPITFSLFVCKHKLISVFDKYKLVIYVCVLYFKLFLSTFVPNFFYVNWIR
jgi:hypothetical protein